MGDPLLAASRDASVLDRPNVRGRKKAHVAVNVQELRSTYWEPNGSLMGDAACNPARAPLDMSVASEAADIHPDQRCQRPGCAARWPPYRGLD